MINWIDQSGGMWSAGVTTAVLYVGVSINPALKPFFWEIQSRDLGGLPSTWGYADTLDEAKALAIANYALNGV